MKFITLIAFIAVAAAQDEEAPAAEPLEANADCSAEGSVCGDGLCCGTATGVESEEGAGDAAEAKVVCSASDAMEWVDEADPDLKYTFACNMMEEGNASQLVASTAALLASAYLLA